MLNLKTVLTHARIKQIELARALNLSRAAVAQITNHGIWPRSHDCRTLQEQICGYLRQREVDEAELVGAFAHATRQDLTGRLAVTLSEISEQDREALRRLLDEEVGEPAAGILTEATVAHPGSRSNHVEEVNQEVSMLLRKQTLRADARKHFGLFRDPFHDDIQSHEDMYLSPDIRYVREAMLQTAKHGGLLAVVAESGAGKTSLVRDLEDRIEREALPIVIVKPYVLAMEDTDTKGKTLKSIHIAEAIMSAVAPLEKLRRSPEARFAQLHKALKDSHAAGYRHCVVIDEAHSLPIATLKHLKRFFELEMGFKKLLSIILVGQPELSIKLSERNQEVREVVQRCEVVELLPLNDGRLEEYLRFKFGRQNKPVAEIIDANGIAALRERLTIPSNRRDRPEISLLYPLAVGNLITACMNLAADIKAPVITAAVVKELRT